MGSVRNVVDVLLLETIEHELGHLRVRHLLTHDALAIQHGEGRDHRHEVAPRTPEHMTRFGRDHNRLLGLARLLMLEPGVLVEHLIAQHPQATEQRHDPLRQFVTRQFAQQQSDTGSAEPRHHDGKQSPQHRSVPEKRRASSGGPSVRAWTIDRWRQARIMLSGSARHQHLWGYVRFPPDPGFPAAVQQ